jgi:hypothetical protein
MRANHLPLLLGVTLSLTACLPPSTLPVYSKDKFRLDSLHDAQVAILPVTEAILDEDTAATVVLEYGSNEKFLEALSAKVSGAVLKVCRVQSLDASAVRGLLESSPETAALLQPGAAIGNPASPGAPPTAGPGLVELAHVEAMRGVRYALALRRVGLARKLNSTGVPAFPAHAPPLMAGGSMQPVPPGPATVVGATVMPGGGIIGGTVVSPSGTTGGMVVGGTAIGGMPMAGGYTAGATVVGGTLIGASAPGSMSGGMGAMPFNTGPATAGVSIRVTTNAQLEWAVVDLQSGEVVWVGQSGTFASSLFMKAAALHEVEEQLAEVVARELSQAPVAAKRHSRDGP